MKLTFHMIFYSHYQKKGKISAYDIGDKEWIDAESPMVLERNVEMVEKIIKQMGV